MDRLILLVGASGVGKTTVVRKLESKGYNIIQSYTTRKPREVGEWGHIFVDYVPSDMGNVIAVEEVYGGDYYWATKEQYEGMGDSIYVVCPKGAEQVISNIKGEVEVITIYLVADENMRYRRMISSRDIIGAIDRVKVDNVKYRSVKCDYVVDANQELDVVVDSIVNILNS